MKKMIIALTAALMVFGAVNAFAFTSIFELENGKAGTSTVLIPTDGTFENGYMNFQGKDTGAMTVAKVIAPNDGTCENGYLNFKGEDLALNVAAILNNPPSAMGK